MLTNGLVLTALGMGWVFLFLLILIGVIQLVGFLNKIFPEKTPAVEAPKAPVPTTSSEKAKVAAAIAAAHHRSTR